MSVVVLHAIVRSLFLLPGIGVALDDITALPTTKPDNRSKFVKDVLRYLFQA
jgi:hypothetical protein